MRRDTKGGGEGHRGGKRSRAVWLKAEGEGGESVDRLKHEKNNSFHKKLQRNNPIKAERLDLYVNK